MKQNLLLVINGVLAVAVVVLFFLFFNYSKINNKSLAKEDSCSSEEKIFPVAFIDVDSLLHNYEFTKQANEKLLSQSEKAEARLQREMEQWQKDGMEFQRKIQTNSFLSRDRAEQEEMRLMKKRDELENLRNKLSRDLMDEQRRMNEQLRDTINSFLKDFNMDKKYQIILSNTMNDNILYSEQAHNITSEVVDALNLRYNKK